MLNKADTVKPEELMRVQSALIWNISPLMSSAQPPVMYTVSLWSMPYEPGAPVRLLQAQERELLRDLRQAIDKRIENKIASARRFAVSLTSLVLSSVMYAVSLWSIPYEPGAPVRPATSASRTRSPPLGDWR